MKRINSKYLNKIPKTSERNINKNASNIYSKTNKLTNEFLTYTALTHLVQCFLSIQLFKGGVERKQWTGTETG